MSGVDAFQAGAAWTDLSSRGRFVATGEDRERLIHAICSNVVEGLAPGRGTYAFFLNAQGRILSDSHIFVESDSILIDCEPEAGDSLREHIEAYIIMDDVSLEDIASTTRLLVVAGTRSREVVSSLLGTPPEDALAFVQAGDRRVFRVPVGTTDAYWILAGKRDAQVLPEAVTRHGAVQVDASDFDALRVASGVPRFGPDFGSRNIPQETQQFNAVSFDKGCYTGQEIVERVRSRGRVRRLLVGVELESPSIPDELTIQHKGRAVGKMTSPTAGSLASGKARGFAIVRREAAAPGTEVQVSGSRAWILDVSRT